MLEAAYEGNKRRKPLEDRMRAWKTLLVARKRWIAALCALGIMGLLLTSSPGTETSLVEDDPIAPNPAEAVNKIQASDNGPVPDPVEAPEPAEPLSKLEVIRSDAKEMWKAYETYAWGYDNFRPVTKSGHDEYGTALTMVDAMDTMWLLGLKPEFERARAWIVANWTIERWKTYSQQVSIFELTIRVLGGLLSAFHQCNDKALVDTAAAIADELLEGFHKDTGIPASYYIPKTGAFRRVGGTAVMAEAGSIQLEWRELSRITGNPMYADAVNKAFQTVLSHMPRDNLLPNNINAQTGVVRGKVTTGGMVDSVYEYMLKLRIQDATASEESLTQYLASIRAIKEKLVKVTPSGRWFFAEFHNSQIKHRMEHLSCFMPGMLALGSQYAGEDRELHMELARETIKTCVFMYESTATGLAPESVMFDFVKDTMVVSGKHNILRPETMESLFIMWRLTHDPIYREWGWDIYTSFRTYAKRADGTGFCSLKDINDQSTLNGNIDSNNWLNTAESFFLAETVKYAFLLFSDDDVLPLDQWVFTTEAHPFPIQSSS